METKITVKDFCNLFTMKSQSIEIWSFAKMGSVFIGMIEDVLDTEYAEMPIISVDTLSTPSAMITINV